MSQKLSTLVLATALFVSSSLGAFAASADHPSLAPGKAAGVKEAALRAPIWVWVAGVGFVALGVGLVASGNGNGTSSGTTTSTHL
ncbi:MAG: hypothetical protein WDM86_15530 [Rhizomicrobium sp.]